MSTSSLNHTNPDTTVPQIRRRLPKSQRRRDGLIQFANDVTSQNGEDGILHHIFTEILPSSKIRYCVDVGAWDGRHLSNTNSLLVPGSSPSSSSSSLSSSWKGILIEADTTRFQELKNLHQPLGNVCINTTVSCGLGATNNSLVSILQPYEPPPPQQYTNTSEKERFVLPSDFDFLCIDVDGSDYWLLHQVLTYRPSDRAFPSSYYRPKVVCIEFNPTMPNDLIYIPAQTDDIRHGASLAALVELAQEHDYVLVETTLYNAFFVPRELYETCFQKYVPDTSIEALHETTMGTSLYQLYDGTIKLWGCRKLLWHRIAMDENKMQMLSKSQRSFPFAPNGNNDHHLNTNRNNVISDPVIDLSPYCHHLKSGKTDGTSSTFSIDEKLACSVSLLRQLQKDGFALVQGTGISGQLCRDALRVTHSFLHDADESVRRSCLSVRDRARRGYSPSNTENFASLIGDEGPNDHVRKFRMGNDGTSAGSASAGPSASSLHQPNIWPTPSEHWDKATCRDFQETLENYYDQICIAANSIVQCIRKGLLSEHEELAEALRALSITPGKESDKESNTSLAHSTSILTLLNYQTGARHKKKHHKKKRMVHPLVAAHTDVGVITVLLYDGGDCAVLQRQSAGKEGFSNVILPYEVPDDPIFVVNIADCLSALTQKKLPSTIHRVMPQDEGKVPRNCLALFVGLEPDQSLTIDDGVVISYESWRKNRIAEAQQVLKSKKKS